MKWKLAGADITEFHPWHCVLILFFKNPLQSFFTFETLVNLNYSISYYQKLSLGRMTYLNVNSADVEGT